MEQLQIVAKITPGAIQTNFEETKQWLAQKLQKYNLSNYTGDDAIKQMKEGRATLNKLSDALKERKRVVKEQFLEPYTAFEMAADELLAMIQESCDTLDGKIKEYVLIEKQEREKEITKYYREAVAEAGITYDLWTQIYDGKWLNKSCSKKTWKMAITEAIQSYQKNIMLLGQLAGEDDFEAARKLYEVDLNLQDAITFITKKKAEAEALERERIRIAAEEAAKATGAGATDLSSYAEADAKADTGHAGTKSRDELPDWYSDRWKHNVRKVGSRHIRTGNVATGIWYPAGDATAATGTAGKCTDPTVSAATHFADTGGRTVYVYGT
ncbi:MAG: DUF1351 domain-containing protein [Eubacterium sp.]|nr:DUF1351 domain-containing protein [Eubacterium sp.]